jgi:hypothetical protein
MAGTLLKMIVSILSLFKTAQHSTSMKELAYFLVYYRGTI